MRMRSSSLKLVFVKGFHVGCFDFTKMRNAVADPGGGQGGHGPPRPVKIGHKKDGCRRRAHRFHVSRPPLTRPLDPLL